MYLRWLRCRVGFSVGHEVSLFSLDDAVHSFSGGEEKVLKSRGPPSNLLQALMFLTLRNYAIVTLIVLLVIVSKECNL